MISMCSFCVLPSLYINSTIYIIEYVFSNNESEKKTGTCMSAAYFYFFLILLFP